MAGWREDIPDYVPLVGYTGDNPHQVALHPVSVAEFADKCLARAFAAFRRTVCVMTILFRLEAVGFVSVVASSLPAFSPCHDAGLLWQNAQHQNLPSIPQPVI